MTTLDDLDTPSISTMSTDEAIELLRQLRLSRRTPTKKSVERGEKKRKAKATPSLSVEQAAKLLELLGG